MECQIFLIIHIVVWGTDYCLITIPICTRTAETGGFNAWKQTLFPTQKYNLNNNYVYFKKYNKTNRTCI